MVVHGSWTVLGDDDVPVVPVDWFLAYLTSIGRSPNTVRAHAHDLKDFWVFIGFRGLDWKKARLEDIGGSSRGCSCRRGTSSSTGPGEGYMASTPASWTWQALVSSSTTRVAAASGRCGLSGRLSTCAAMRSVTGKSPGRHPASR